MALILNEIGKLYNFLNDEINDDRTENWPLMKTPFPGLTLLFLYLWLVFKWGPKFMEKRKPYDLRIPIALYNIVQIAACFYIVYQGLRLGWATHYTYTCQPVEENTANGLEFAWKVCYGYFVVKIVDLLDTIFFVLRKKQNQVTFLHVYHHFGMVMLSWSLVKWLPGGHGSLLILINSAVHIIMYTYYLLTIWDPSYKQSVWWKKHVTQIQILQFTILLFHFIALLLEKDCGYPRFPAVVLIPQNLFMVVLFSDFYYKSYIRPRKERLLKEK